MKSESGKITLAAVITVSAIFLGALIQKNINLAEAADKVTICHSTDSQANPYITNDPNKSGDVSGHDDHDGAVWYQGIADHSWGDIIPPFEYEECTGTGRDKICTTENYAGKNWTTDGQAIWNNNCSIPGTPSLSPTPTATATPTITPSPTPVVPTEKPCDGDCNEPTSTPTSTPVATETPNSDLCANIDGIQYSIPEGKHLDASGKNCVEFGVPGGPESGIGGGQVLGTSTSQVLGASTMAGTGAVTDAFFNAIFGLGSLLTSFGIMKNGKKKGQN